MRQHRGGRKLVNYIQVKKLSDLVESINTLAKAKRSQADFVRFLGSQEERRRKKLGTRIKDCGSFLLMREWLDHDGKVTVGRANFCEKHLACRVCAIRRAAKYGEAYEEKIEAFRNLEPYTKPIFVTFTIKNRESLADAVTHLTRSFSRLWKEAKDDGRRVRMRRAPSELLAVRAGVRSLEVKRGKGGLWHPHLHCLFFVPHYISQAKLSQEWLRVTGDSMVVDVRRTREGQDIRAALCEILKYVTKFSELTNEDRLEIVEYMKGKRTIVPVAGLRGIEVPESLLDEPLSGEWIEYYCRYLHKKNGYTVKEWGRGID